MTEITLGQIAAAIAFLVALITGVVYLKKQLEQVLKDAMKNEFEQINKKIDTLDGKVDKVDMQSCKNFLVQFLSNIEKGMTIDEIQKQRFWEQYEHYIKIGGNSYIKSKVDQFKAEGKL